LLALKNTKTIRKIKIYKKTKEKKRKRKVEGAVWKPTNILAINTVKNVNIKGKNLLTRAENLQGAR
jgi:hypothetical protein